MINRTPLQTVRELDRRRLILAIAAGAGAGCLPFPTRAMETANSDRITQYPATLDKSCRTGAAKIYDECGSQRAIFAAALTEANRSAKTLLVVYGAEWCIWCHVFDAYIAGQYQSFEYRFDGQRASLNEYGDTSIAADAKSLNRYVAENFVVAHIEDRYSRDGEKVLGKAGALPRFEGTLPFIFAVTPRGRWAATFDYRPAEVRREGLDWFRGYDRKILLAELKSMRASAMEL